MNVLVTGGAGYIGSVSVKKLQKEKIDVVVLDNLVYGHKNAVDCPLVVADLVNKNKLFSKLKDHKFDAVIHFAAYALAGESMQDPYKYFYNNLLGGLNLLDLMREKMIPYIIFSSSCAVYGTPKILPVKETSPKNPESVYGETKLMFEKMLYWYEHIYGFKYTILRYFNAAGASIDGNLGEDHNPETHIIPIAIKKAMEGKEFNVFGKNYPTKDGTCIRDYIHVEDLAEAHYLALKRLEMKNKSDDFNIGSGKGYSNLEVLKMIEKVSGRKIRIKFDLPRAGDPPMIYADNSKAKKELGFIPKYSNLSTIVESAYKWHSRNP